MIQYLPCVSCLPPESLEQVTSLCFNYTCFKSFPSSAYLHALFRLDKPFLRNTSAAYCNYCKIDYNSIQQLLQLYVFCCSLHWNALMVNCAKTHGTDLTANFSGGTPPRSQGANSLDMPWQSKILCYPTNLTSTFWRTSTSTPLLPKALLHKSRCAWIWIALPAETSFGFESVTLIVLNSPNSS